MSDLTELNRRYQVALENERTAREALRLAEELAIESSKALDVARDELLDGLHQRQEAT